MPEKFQVLAYLLLEEPNTPLLTPKDWQSKVDTTGIDRSGRPI